ncbi:hypothetical protein ACFWY9_39855 [Amycolatopsis sp. NPDC059027]
MIDNIDGVLPENSRLRGAFGAVRRYRIVGAAECAIRLMAELQ